MKLQRWHVGTVVADIGAAIADYERFGPCAVSVAAHLPTRTWDPAAGDVVDEPLEVVFLRDGFGETFELIRPLSTGGPQSRLLAQRPGPTHVAYWCQDPVATAHALLAEGAEIVLLSLADAGDWRERYERGGAAALLPVTAASYLRLAGGLVVELNDGPASRATMTALWGEGVTACLPRMFGASAGPAVEG
ncbi:MAG: VOC family protein [Gammaproteobacteria bacterium]